MRRSAASTVTCTSSVLPALTTIGFCVETRALFTTTARMASSAASTGVTTTRAARIPRASTPAVYQGDTVIWTLSV